MCLFIMLLPLGDSAYTSVGNVKLTLVQRLVFAGWYQ